MSLVNNDWDYWSNPPHMFSIPSGNVGIGTENPEESLDVRGIIQMAGFKMLTGANNGFVLTCDSNGVGTWQEGMPGPQGPEGAQDHDAPNLLHAYLPV